MYFVVSTGRCGSMTIADYLSQSDDTRCFHEPPPFLIREAFNYHIGKLSQPDAVQILRKTRPILVDGKQYGESNLNLSQLIPALHEAFPEARFLWLIRDGRAAVASFLSRKWHSPLMGPQHRDSVITRQWELYRLRGDLVGKMSWWAWNGLSTFEKCCWHWTYINHLIEEQLTACDCKWQQIRLEDLDEKGPALFDFLGVKPPPQAVVRKLNKADRNWGQKPESWRNWSPEQIRAFRLFCADSMDKWYPEWRDELNSEWSKPIAEFPPPPRSVRLSRAIVYPVIRFSTLQIVRINDKYRSLVSYQRQILKRTRRKLGRAYRQVRGFQN